MVLTLNDLKEITYSNSKMGLDSVMKLVKFNNDRIDKNKLNKKIIPYIYLTNKEYKYLQLIYQSTNLNFINNMNIKNIIGKVIESILNKTEIEEKYIKSVKFIIKKLLLKEPEYFYDYVNVNNQIKNKLEIIKKLLCYCEINCELCNKFVYKFSYCKECYFTRENEIKNMFFVLCNESYLQQSIHYFCFIKKELEIKYLEYLKIEEKDILNIKKSKLVNIYNYSKNNDQSLHKIVNYFININNYNQMLNVNTNENIKYNNIKSEIESYSGIDLNIINNKMKDNIYKINYENYDYKNKNIILSKINFNQKLIDKILKYIESFNYKYDDFFLMENYISKQFKIINEKEDIMCIKEIFNKYNIRNISRDKHFKDNFYGLCNDLNFTIYSEIYNKILKKYVPFCIDIIKTNTLLKNNIKIHEESKNKLNIKIKKIYCLLNGLSYICIYNQDILKKNFNNLHVFLSKLEVMDNNIIL